MPRKTLAIACSFCAERADDGYLIVGLKPPTAICGKCVEVCVSIIQQDQARAAVEEPPSADAVDPVPANSVDPSTRD